MSGWRTESIEVCARGCRFPVVYMEAGGAHRPASRSEVPLVYLHGLGSSRLDFAPAAAAPALAGLRLIAVDLPGSGDSPLPGLLAPGITDLVPVVEQVLAAIGGGRVDLIGHSMGGLVGLLVASRNAPAVRSFVNVEGNLAPVDCRVFSRRAVELAETLPACRVIERLAAEILRSDRPGYERFAGRFRSAVQPEAFLRYCRSIVEVSEKEPLLERFLGLRMPRLFVHGRTNRDLPYLDDLRRGGIEVAEIPRSDHFPIDTNPRDFFAALGSFVRRPACRALPAAGGTPPAPPRSPDGEPPAPGPGR